MTSSNCKPFWALALLFGAYGCAWAGLGEPEGSIPGDRMRMHAMHAVARTPSFARHELTLPDGSRVQQWVASNGLVFAVRWNTLHKPDLSSLLGNAFASYGSAARQAALRGGIQRQFRHQESDLVVQSDGHLHVYSGYAYRPSLLPQGIRPQTLGMG